MLFIIFNVMKYIEIHMPESDYKMLWDSMDTSSWYVFGVYDKQITEQMSALFNQIKILKQNGQERTIKDQKGGS